MLISSTFAQIFGPGPSPSSDFSSVFNLPGALLPETTFADGSPGFQLNSNQVQQVNVNDGTHIKETIQIAVGELNITGGCLGRFNVSGGEVNMSGGTVTRLSSVNRWVSPYPSSVWNLSGGTVADESGVSRNCIWNISGGTTGDGCFASGSNCVVNISGGSVGDGFRVRGSASMNISGGVVGNGLEINGSELNISGGRVGNGLNVFPNTIRGSVVNISGNMFFVDGTRLSNLQPGQPFTITDRNVTLSGVLDDGQQFSFDLNSTDTGQDYFASGSIVTITLTNGVLPPGDVNQDGNVNFLDITGFIQILVNRTFSEQADVNQDGVVNFLDIMPFIIILSNQ